MRSSKEVEKQIFICYRRADSAWVAERIYDRLIQKFGEDAVFKDVDSIPLGVNFKQHIDSVIKQCNVVIAVIGKNWVGETTERGERSIDNPRDYIRIEIESALERDIPIIPLIVQNASIPSDEDLPPSLKELSYRSGMSISNDPHFHTDMDRLIRSLEFYLIGSSQTEAQGVIGETDSEEVVQSEEAKKRETGFNYLKPFTSLPKKFGAFVNARWHASSTFLRRRVKGPEQTQPDQPKRAAINEVFQSLIIVFALWFGIVASINLESSRGLSGAEGITYPVFILLLFLIFGSGGAVLGFLWPKGWLMWGVALAIIPSLFYITVGFISLLDAFGTEGSFGPLATTLINSLVLCSSACAGSYLGARYSARKNSV
jgi:TIR domain